MGTISIYADTESLSRAVADLFIEIANLAVNNKGCFSVALAGGSTPQKSYQLLASKDRADRVDWSKVHIFWGDERCVPPNDSDSNYHMAGETFINKLPIPTPHIYRIEGERIPSDAARYYQNRLREFFVGKPQFDLILLGMGEDGHTASLFPGTKALQNTKDWVSANYVEKLSTWRITLTPHVINQAGNITFIVSGKSKAKTLSEVLQGEYQPDRYPSQLIKPTQGILNWYIDKLAAKQLNLKKPPDLKQQY